MAESETVNSCCSALKEKFLKLEEKRNALRQAVKLLDSQTDKLQKENLNLKKAYEKECTRANSEREAKDKECNAKQELEKTVCDLKSEITSLKSGRLEISRECGLEMESEMRMLKGLLEKERNSAESERKKVEIERKKADEALKLLRAEKIKAEEGKRLTDTERNKSEELRLSLEKMKKESSEVRGQLVTARSKLEEANRNINNEKQKRLKEKTRADDNMVKAEEYKKSANINKKKATEEKFRADELHKQLELVRHEKMVLEKEMLEKIAIVKEEKVKHSKSKKEAINEKILRKKLKWEKTHLKHVKEKAKLEAIRNDLLRRELYLLKQDAIQFSHRLIMLDNHLFLGGSREKMGKVNSSLLPEHLELRNLVPEVYDLRHTTECDLLKSYVTKMYDLGTTPGISSELESPIDTFVKNKSLTSAVHSSTASLSDRQLVGLQGQLNKDLKMSLTVPRINGVTKVNYDTCELDKKDNNDDLFCSKFKEQFLNSKNCETESMKQKKKRKKIPSTMKSDPYLHLKVKKLHVETEKELSVLDDMLDVENRIQAPVYPPSNEGILELGLSSPVKLTKRPLKDDYQSRKKNIMSKGQNYLPCHRNNEKGKSGSLEMEERRIVTPSVTRSRQRDNNTLGTKSESKLCHKEMIIESCMKLLELESDSDEARYRIAMDMPLSPTLPRIVLPVVEIDSESHNSAADICKKSTNEADDLRCDASELMNVDTHSSQLICLLPSSKDSSELSQKDEREISHNCYHDSNMLRDKQNISCSLDPVTSAAVHTLKGCRDFIPRCDRDLANSLFIKDGFSNSHSSQDWKEIRRDVCTEPFYMSRDSVIKETTKRCQAFKEQGNEFGGDGEITCLYDKPDFLDPGHSHHGAKEMEQLNAQKILTSTKSMSAFSCKEPNTLFENDGFCSISKCCIVFSYSEDSNAISRIFNAWINCIRQMPMTGCKNWMIGEILLALSMERSLIPQEKCCVFLSLLLYNFSLIPSQNHDIFNPSKFSFILESLSTQLNSAVKSSAAAGYLLTELCEQHILLDNIADFLINRQVMVYDAIRPEHLQRCDMNAVVCVPSDKHLFQAKLATIDQLIVGSLALSAICHELDHIGFICETSYNLLQTCGVDLLPIMTILHAFALACGEKYFDHASYKLIMTIIKSIVSVLELREESKLVFCTQCPFGKDVISIDKVTLMLMENLQECIVSISQCSNVDSSTSSTYISIRNQNRKCAKELDIACDMSCSLFKYRRISVPEPNYVADDAFCDFCDTISLVELIAWYMKWEWTCAEVLPRLLKLLQGVPEEFSIAILMLIGELGRMENGSTRKEQKVLEDVRCHLAKILDQSSSEKSHLPLQLAAINALVGLLPWEFEQLSGNDPQIWVDEMYSDYVKLVQNWFSKLNEVQRQSLPLSIFKSCTSKNRRYNVGH